MSAPITQYTSLITSEHNQRPNFMASLAALVQGFADIGQNLSAVPAAFDVDVAVGVQLDVVGEWVGVTRDVTVPIPGAFFSLDSSTLGLDQGVIFGPGSSNQGLTVLPDANYRILIFANIAANQWDGTVPGAYAAYALIFEPLGYQILIQDNQDMTMTLALWGPIPDPVTLSLFQNGLIELRPAGVGVTDYITESVANAPFFGLDVENQYIAGLDVGAIGIST